MQILKRVFHKLLQKTYIRISLLSFLDSYILPKKGNLDT